jgi:hypothetical protein
VFGGVFTIPEKPGALGGDVYAICLPIQLFRVAYGCISDRVPIHFNGVFLGD